MRAHSIELYSGILEIETGSPVGFHQTGALRVTRSKDRMDDRLGGWRNRLRRDSARCAV